MRLKTMLMLILLSLALLAGAPAAFAGDEEKNDGLARVVMITAKDGKAKALEEAITEYHHYMADKEGAWRYNWYSVITGPDTGTYIARSGGHDWEDFDADYDWGKEAGEKFEAEVLPYIKDFDVYLTRTDYDLGIWPESMEGYKYISIYKWSVKPGEYDTFYEGLKKIDATLKEGGWPNFYAFADTLSGEAGSGLTLAVPRKSFADMAPKEPGFMDIMKKAMGEAEAEAFMDDWGSTYKTVENKLLKYRPKLSDYGDD